EKESKCTHRIETQRRELGLKRDLLPLGNENEIPSQDGFQLHIHYQMCLIIRWRLRWTPLSRPKNGDPSLLSVRPSWHRPSRSPPPGSCTPATDEDVRGCRSRSTVPAPGVTPAPYRSLECKYPRISRSSTIAPRTRCPAHAPDRPCSP